MRSATVILAVVFALGAITAEAGCAHPYSGKPEKLKKPRKKRKPESAQQAENAEAPVLDEKCRTNFFADNSRVRRRTRTSRQLTRQAEEILLEAERQEGSSRITAVGDALGKLRNALQADPYSAEATYRMAAAYASVGKKGCAVALLQRLNDLTKMPAAEASAERAINRALRDQSFDLFRKDADQALGR
ncbi:MAG: hypothetical protein MJE77_10515 [Proteobacteria bacterium]|nr:hypothetical protein [Pseudomonadota bacterium]